MATYWVYILECSNGAFYTGYTHNLEKRYQEHCEGKGAKYTRSFKPLRIAQSWEAIDKAQAMKAEHMIDRLDAITAMRDINIELKREILLQIYAKETFHQDNNC